MTSLEAIAILGGFKYNPLFNDQQIEAFDMAISALSENKGEWIEKEVFDGDVAYECSECGELFCLIDGTPADNLYNFCPNCGARMKGGE